MTGQERDDMRERIALLLWVTDGFDAEAWCHDPHDGYREYADAILASDWLRERDQRIKAEAWEEGAEANEAERRTINIIPNPYRKEQDT